MVVICGKKDIGCHCTLAIFTALLWENFFLIYNINYIIDAPDTSNIKLFQPGTVIVITQVLKILLTLIIFGKKHELTKHSDH